MKHLFSIVLIFSLFSCKTTQTLPDPLQAGWNGKKVCEVLQDTKQQRILKCTFPPGIGHEKHYHNPHFGYTLKGGTFKITDTSGTKTITVPTGAFLLHFILYLIIGSWSFIISEFFDSPRRAPSKSTI